MSAIWDGMQEGLRQALSWLHSALEPVFGVYAWGWAIIALTIVVRLAMTPLAIKQTRSMRAMQSLQPKIKAIQKKYKADRELMRKDPELYRSKKSKMNEELTALYKEEGVNPAGGCLPLLLQAPVFFALFRVLQNFAELKDAPFYFFTPGASALEGAARGLGATVREAGVPGYILIVAMAGTMFWSQRQMMARSAATVDPQQAQQQKMLMYFMPAMLAFFSLNFPMGVLLYWVTTNVWQIGQQTVILREVAHDTAGEGDAAPPKPSGSRPGGADTSTKSGTRDAGAKGGQKGKSDGAATSSPPRRRGSAKPSDARGHLPSSNRKKK